MKRLLACIAMLPLCACASIMEGSTQEVLVNTNPAGAACTLAREGQVFAHINPTPGAATIKKSKHDMTIVCKKDGYEDATYLNHSGSEGATWGNIVLGGGIGWAVDSANGSDNHYESPVNITLNKK